MADHLLGDAHPTQHLRDRYPGLSLLQCEGDLLFGESALLHGSAPSVRVSQNRKTRTHVGPKRLGGRGSAATSRRECPLVWLELFPVR